MTFCHIFIIVTLKHLSSMSFVCFAYFMSFHSNTGLTTSQIWNQVFVLPCPSSLCSRSELNLLSLFGQALDLLVTVSYMCYHTSTSALSTSSSSRGLTNLRYGISHLEGGFTLRCLQRLSLPDLATLLCHWYDNRYTSGPSSPVLSY